jgi:predicted dehydrogenase
MSQVKIGIAGAGVFGGYHAVKFAALPEALVVGVFDADPERANALAMKCGCSAASTFAALLEVCDAVVVATPPTTHGSMVLQALKSGRHVLVEKPLASSVDEALAIAELVRSSNQTLQVGHQERIVFQSMGLLGASEKPFELSSVREGPWSGRSADVSVTLDLMVHDIDLALILFGSVRDVDLKDARSVHGGIDAVEAELTFVNGGRAHLGASRIASERSRTMHLKFPSGALDVDFVARTFSNASAVRLNEDFGTLVPDPLGAADVFFLNAILGRGAPLATAQDGFDAVEIALRVDALASNYLGMT